MRRTGTYAGALAALLVGLGGCGTSSGPDPYVPGPNTLVALTATGELLAFDLETPGTVQGRHLVTGLPPGEDLLAIDVAGAQAELVALGRTGRLYRIARDTGAALALGTTPFTPAPAGSHVGFEADEATAIVTGDGGQLLQIDRGSGTAQVLPAPAYDPLDEHAGLVPVLAGAAAGASIGSPWLIDSAQDALVALLPGSALLTRATLGVDVPPALGFDIVEGLFTRALTTLPPPEQRGYLAFAPPGEAAAHLFRLDLETGALLDEGALGGGAVVVDIAIVSGLRDP